MKKRAGKVESESEEEKKSLGKVVGWEREDEEGEQEKVVEEHKEKKEKHGQEQRQEEKKEKGEQEDKWKNPYLIFLDNLEDIDGEEEVSSDSFFYINFPT